MSKNSFQKSSPQIQGGVSKNARSIQRPALAKARTKLIAQGIQQGIDLYNQQLQEKARALSKQRKKLANQKAQLGEQGNDETQESYRISRALAVLGNPDSNRAG